MLTVAARFSAVLGVRSPAGLERGGVGRGRVGVLVPHSFLCCRCGCYFLA